MKNLVAVFVTFCFVFALVGIVLAADMKVEGKVEKMEGEFVSILDAKGKTVTRFDASLGDLMHSTHGTSVHFPKSSQYYAALQTNLTLNRSVLTLYDGTETIAYQAVLGGTCFSIASLPGPNGDRLLIGCSGEILEYSLSNTTNSASVGAPPQNRRAD